MIRIITRNRELKLLKREAEVKGLKRELDLLATQLLQERIGLNRAREQMDQHFENWAVRIMESERVREKQ